MKIRYAAVLAAALTLGLLAPASSAYAAGEAAISLSSSSTATVGVAQPLNLIISSTGGIDPTGTTASFAANGAVIGTSPVVLSGGVWTSTANWTPANAGAATLTAYWGSTVSSNVPVSVNAVGTRTTITSPNYATLGTWVPITVTVAASAGTLVPPGAVTLNGTGGYSQSIALSPGSGSTSTATTNYFAGTPGAVTLNATYNPSTNGAITSSSTSDTMTVNSSSAPVTISVPTSITVGVPTAITVFSNATQAGYATVTANGTALVTNEYFTNGKVVINGTPKTAGTFTLTATITAPNGTQYSTTDSAAATVATEVDTITLVINGYGALSTTTPFMAANGSVFGLTPTAASGAAVSVTTSGPCVQNQAILTIPTGSGSCTMTAKSPGGNGRSAMTAKYPITLMAGAQTSTVNPKANGTYAVNSKFTLASTSAKTNANQKIKWKVTSGSSYCKIVTESNNYKVKLGSTKGKSCTVQGTAPAVKGQWNSYLIERKYKTK